MSNEELYNEILNATENNIDMDIVYNTAGYAPVAGTNTGGYPPTVVGGGPAVKAKAKIAGDGTLNTQVRGGKFYIRIT
tara:strand:- start:1429 stop:1662 length:234 start_codon:yes stop_codon:yes gene_type:complete